MTVIVGYQTFGTAQPLKGLQIGQDEVPVNGQSLGQCLAEMQRQGWLLTLARAIPNLDGVVCQYEFARLKEMA